ncbi:MAG TPA: DUF4276 family protein [Planctomycetota bacterium]|nr:DUF4276 family protein [Planctomycetota bacterium]
MPLPRLVLFVEGEGDCEAAPILIRRMLSENSERHGVLLDHDPFRIGDVTNITGNSKSEWLRFIKQARRDRANVAGILTILDGDKKKVEARNFCANEVAVELAKRARESGAGSVFSLAVVFACMEYETWLVAGHAEHFAKYNGPDLEQKRNAKQLLGRPYSPVPHQAEFTRSADLNMIRSRNLRSFRRLENAVQQLLRATKSNAHVCTPQ